jgi:hypothetical protein
MNGCEEVREILVAVARGEMVSAAGQRFLREHAESCSACRCRLANERMLSAGLTAMAAASDGVPSAAVRAALMAEFRRRRTVTPMPRIWTQRAKWLAVAAVAAAVLLAVFLSIGHRAQKPVEAVRAPSTMAPPQPPVTASIKPPVPPSLPAETKAAVPVKHRAASHPRRVVKKDPAPQEEPAEVASEFLEIPYVEPLRPEQRADVFRVQIPRANMAVFGLPVTGGRLDARVTADILMGEDGVVRAIRFIR